MGKNIFEITEEVLKTNSKYISEDGKLLKAVVYSDVMTMDKELLSLLLSDEKIKKRFFEEVNDIFVFDKQKFAWFIESKEFLPDSYTRYKNKIGLTHNGDFISKSNDVVLDFPYKDCVLEGGQDKDDQKRKEIFYNETIASDEVSKMLAPKVFTNAKRYTKDGVEENINFDENDNLIIKGNNLIALSSLLEGYEGKVRCIYIDPPYYFNKSKPADAFKYNSNFKLSSWLSFMKTRLEIAYKLLKNQGVIFCHIGEDGIHWIKILLEELFGIDNFVETFIWKNTDNPDSLSPKSRSSVEYIICYEKNKNNSIVYKGKKTENGDAPLLNTGNSIHSLTFPSNTIKFNIDDGVYSGKPDRVEIVGECIVKNGTNIESITLIGEFKWSQQMLDEEIRKGTYFLVKTSKFSVRFQRIEATSMAPEKFIDEQYLSKAIGVGTNEDATSHLKDMVLKFPYSKPESVIYFLLQATTKENDIILDYFSGSGTTCAVAHKMGRRYIGVEQMDYIEDITVERMKKVIDGEQGGISKAVNWQGGGSFVYCELLENANVLIEKIQSSREDTIYNVKAEIYADERIVPYITRKELEETDAEFEVLTLEEKKQALIALVDMNKLYVNYSDMEDITFDVSESDKAFTKSFYKGGLAWLNSSYMKN